MKTAISLPDDLFESAEQLATRLGTTRSGLYARALSEFVDKHRSDAITAQLNSVYDEIKAELDPTIAAIQSQSIAGEW
jgi:predicted transcriptional regulator